MSEYKAVENTIIDYLDELEDDARVERIDDLIHRLNFERRLTLLAPNQREAMNNRSLSSAQRVKLDACETDVARDTLFQAMARTQYFRDCMWSDYLNGVHPDPPVPSTE